MDQPDPRAEPFPPVGCHLKDLGSRNSRNSLLQKQAERAQLDLAAALRSYLENTWHV